MRRSLATPNSVNTQERTDHVGLCLRANDRELNSDLHASSFANRIAKPF